MSGEASANRTTNRNGATLEEIADLYGCTRERIRQIEDKALKKLKRELIRRGINPKHILPDDSITDKDF
jgi:DNA-directed RNA polymerase sigma subunit (sigma70/sigma32)